MGTKIDSRFMYLRFEQGLTEAQMNSLVNEVIASNELLLANSSNREDLLYDLVVNRLTGTVKEAAATKEVDETSNRKGFDVYMVTHKDVMATYDEASYRVYATLKASSNFEGTTIKEWNNYIRKRGAKQVILDLMNGAKEEFNGKVPAARTVERQITKLINKWLKIDKKYS